MRNISIEEQETWLSGSQKNLTLTFSDGTILTNDDILAESMSLIRNLYDEDDICFGKCTSSVFSVDVFSSQKKFNGLYVTPVLSVSDGTNTYEWKIGRFKVEEEVKSSNSQKKSLTCYDDIYYFGNLNLTDWYRKLTFPISVRDFRNQFFQKIGITQKAIDLPSDNIVIENNIAVDSISGLDIIESICELNACFGVVNSQGEFEYVKFISPERVLYPADDLYPSDSLFPKTDCDLFLKKSDYLMNSLDYEDYIVKTIDKVIIRDEVGQISAESGVDGNTYYITDNYLCYGMSAAEQKKIADNFLVNGRFLPFNQAKLDTICRPWIELGDFVKVLTDNSVITFPITKMNVRGITGLRQTIASSGQEYFTEEMYGIERQIQRINHITSRISQTNEEILLEVEEQGKSISSINQRANNIELSVQGKVGNDEIISKINLSPEKIQIEAKNVDLTGYTTFSDLSGDGTTTINGANIKTGKINCDRLDGGTINGQTISGGTISGSVITAKDKLEYVNYYDSDHILTGSFTSNVEKTKWTKFRIYENYVDKDDFVGMNDYSHNLILTPSAITSAGGETLRPVVLVKNNAHFEGHVECDSDLSANKLGADYGYFLSAVANDLNVRNLLRIDGGLAVWGADTSHEYAVHWDGSSLNFNVDGTWVWSSSDERLKKNIKLVDERFLDSVGSVDLVQFNLNRENYDDSILYFGAIAQDVAEKLKENGLSEEGLKFLFKNKITDDGEEYYGIDYEQFLLIRIASDERKIKKLEDEVSELKSSMEEIMKEIKTLKGGN